MGCDARRAVVDRQAIDAEVSLVSKVGAPHYGYVRPAEQIEMVAREASSLAAQFVGRDHQRQFGNGQRGNRERHRVVRITTDVGVDDDRCGRERRRAGRGRTSNFHRAVEAGELVMALAQADRRPPVRAVVVGLFSHASLPHRQLCVAVVVDKDRLVGVRGTDAVSVPDSPRVRGRHLATAQVFGQRRDGAFARRAAAAGYLVCRRRSIHSSPCVCSLAERDRIVCRGHPLPSR